MNNVRCVWVLPFVVASLCLATATSAFAQGGTTGTLTGTVVDSSGSAVPGATVTATEAETAAVRTVVSNENGLFRISGLDPGRYTVKVELTSFKPIAIEAIALSAAEIRDLGKVTLQVGALTETVSVTSEVTPVQVADSARRKTVTGDDLQNIQMKGRDIYNLLAVLPGVQDTNLNRDYSTWSSATSITINGAPSQNKDVRVDGINIVDEGGCGTAFVNLNMDAVGEIQVISNGYTAENGRNNGGMINVVTKSGSNTFKGSAWYNGRRDQFNENDYFRKVNNQAKPLYDVNISGYGFGGPLVIPGVVDARKATTNKTFFYVSQEYTVDKRPTTTQRNNMPTALERVGDFSQTRVTNGTIQTIIDPQTGQQFPNNIIPANRISPLGQKMLNLLPMPNGILNLQPGQEWTSNSAYDTTPEHGRTNTNIRIDQVYSSKTRQAFKIIKDRDDTWSYNNFTPGTGHVNNNTPGILLSSTLTQVLKPTVVNEMNFGYTHNRWGFTVGPEDKVGSNYDYTKLYASTLGIVAPRLQPFGDFSDPPALSGFGGPQTDEWPYAPRFSTSGGNRAGLAGYMSGGNPPYPRLNMSARATWADDLSVTRGRHNIKIGVSIEFNHKTEPGSADYMGNYNFANDTSNPLNTGNGYANMLLGAFSTYTELTARVDKAVRHWQNDVYLQDNWRMTPRLTLDYGVRLQHSGSDYEVNNNHTGFFTDQWAANQAARVYTLVCTTSGVAGNQACPAANQRTIDPANPGAFFPAAFNGNIVPGTGIQINGVSTDGISGAKAGTYFKFPWLVAAPRVGLAWNVTGDGKTALRSSWGIFYNFPRSTGTGGYNFAGGCPVSCSNQIRWATFDDISAVASGSGTVQLVQSPVNVNVGGYDQPLAKSYNMNVAFQRDIGFNTVAEIAYVGNFAYESGRTVDINRLPLYVYGNPDNLVNNAPLNVNSLRPKYGPYPGMGSVTQFFKNLNLNSLQYNAMQLNLQRRLSHGLQAGFAYTYANGNGYCAQGCNATNPGYDPYTDQIGGQAALKARYWGPTAENRKHNMIVNYSYDIPSFTDNAFIKPIVRDWQISGVTRLQSGAPITPTCSSNNAGIQNSNPSLTDGITSRCQLVGDPFTLTPEQIAANKNLPFADQVHFNVAAFAMAQPNGSVGNFGNTPVGILRQPTWHEWDITLSRRFPVTVMGRKNSGIKLQFQAYNVFNEVQFTNMDASFTFTGTNNSQNSNANTGKYVATGTGLAAGTIAPRTMGLTVRFDW